MSALMHPYTVILLLLLFASGAWGENPPSANLVQNPSFETYTICPKRIVSKGKLSGVTGWEQPTRGSADYFNACSKVCGVPVNKLGIQNARTGKAMVGIYVSKPNYREYIQTELLEVLQAHKRYRLTFYVSLSEYSSEAIASLGGLLTRQAIGSETTEILKNHHIQTLNNGVKSITTSLFNPQVVNPNNQVLSDTQQWMQVSGTFVAEGGERFLTIGNFRQTAHSSLTAMPHLSSILSGAYYYIDDVELIYVDEPLPLETEAQVADIDLPAIAKPHFEIGQTFVLDNLYFAFDKSTILPASKPTLDALLNILKEHPNMRILLMGHTDDIGSKTYNQRLSQERAQAVASHLEDEGIAKSRLEIVGLGNENPLDQSQTEEARTKNRRVEVRILSL